MDQPFNQLQLRPDGRRNNPRLVPMESLERERQAFAMRLRGCTWAAIGKAIGVTPQGAHAACKRAIKRGQEELAEVAADHITVDLARIDKLIHAVWKPATEGDGGAIDRVLKLIERRAKLLGLDAPSKSVLTGANGGPLQTETVAYVVRTHAVKGDDGSNDAHQGSDALGA